MWAIEGSGSYGAGLVRYLVSRGETVLETSRVPQRERRLRGKDDALGAVRTARAALAGEAERLAARQALLMQREKAGQRQPRPAAAQR